MQVETYSSREAYQAALKQELDEIESRRGPAADPTPRGVTRSIFLVLETERITTGLLLCNYWEKRQGFTPEITGRLFDAKGVLVDLFTIPLDSQRIVAHVPLRARLREKGIAGDFLGTVWLEARHPSLFFPQIGCVATYYSAKDTTQVHSHIHVGTDPRQSIPEQHVVVWSRNDLRSFFFFPAGPFGFKGEVTIQLTNVRGETLKRSRKKTIAPFGCFFVWLEEVFPEMPRFLMNEPGWLRTDWEQKGLNKRGVVGSIDLATGSLSAEHTTGYKYPKYRVDVQKGHWIECVLPWPNPQTSEFEVYFNEAETAAEEVILEFLVGSDPFCARQSVVVNKGDLIGRLRISQLCEAQGSDRTRIQAVRVRFRYSRAVAACPDICAVWWPADEPGSVSALNIGCSPSSPDQDLMMTKLKRQLKAHLVRSPFFFPLVRLLKRDLKKPPLGPKSTTRKPSKWAPVLRMDEYDNFALFFNNSNDEASARLDLWGEKGLRGTVEVAINPKGQRVVKINEAFGLRQEPREQERDGYLLLTFMNQARIADAFYYGVHRQTGRLFCDHWF